MTTNTDTAALKPRAYIIHAPHDEIYGRGPDKLQFHPLAQHDIDAGYTQTPLYAAPVASPLVGTWELSGISGELREKVAEAIRSDGSDLGDTPWEELSDERKIGWLGDADRALAVVKEYFTSHRDPVGGQHPDDLAVDRFAAAMKAKLAQKREEGRGGWDNRDECTAEYLSYLLIQHCWKGDPLDVGSLAMMLHQRGDRIVIDEETRAIAPAGEARETGGVLPLTEIRYRVRNIWGAISSGQITDKDVEGQAKRLLADIDAALSAKEEGR